MSKSNNDNKKLLLAYYIDYAFFNVAAWLFLALLVLGVPEDAWAVYLFSLAFMAFTAIMIAEPIMLVFYFGSARSAMNRVKLHALEAWRWFSSLILTTYNFALGKIVIGLLVINTVAVVVVWLKYHLNVPEFFNATYALVYNIVSYLGDYKALTEAIQRWLHSIFVDWIVEFMRLVWVIEFEFISERPIAGLIVPMIVTVMLSGMAIMIKKFAPRAYASAFSSIRVSRPLTQ